MTRPSVARMTVAEYVAHEKKSAVRHELFDGQVCAMAGGSPNMGPLGYRSPGT